MKEELERIYQQKGPPLFLTAKQAQENCKLDLRSTPTGAKFVNSVPYFVRSALGMHGSVAYLVNGVDVFYVLRPTRLKIIRDKLAESLLMDFWALECWEILSHSTHLDRTVSANRASIETTIKSINLLIYAMEKEGLEHAYVLPANSITSPTARQTSMPTIQHQLPTS